MGEVRGVGCKGLRLCRSDRCGEFLESEVRWLRLGVWDRFEVMLEC